MIVHDLKKLRVAQAKFIAARDAAERDGSDGARALGSKKVGPYRISYNGRVWLFETLILEADGTEPVQS